MIARNILSTRYDEEALREKSDCTSNTLSASHRNIVDAEAPLLEVFRKFMNSPQKELAVIDNDKIIGIIDAQAMLKGLNKVLIPRDDCSIVEIECRLNDFSASRIAHAVEDVDAHLLDMLSNPTDDGHIRVIIRVGHIDATATVRSLERYGFSVLRAFGSQSHAAELSYERLGELALYLNI